MMRHLLPQLAQLSELWPKQFELLRPSQKSALSGTMNPVQRLLPHLGAVLCSAARHPGEPRRALVVEAVVALRALADGPKSQEEQGSYGAQVATVSSIVARLLSAASADRKDDKDEDAEAGAAEAPGGSSASPKKAAGREAKTQKRGRSFFSAAGELQALREGFVAVLKHLAMRDAGPASAVVRCLELLSRWEVQTGPEPRDSESGELLESDARVLRALRDAPLEHVEVAEKPTSHEEDDLGEGWVMDQMDDQVDGDEAERVHDDGEEDGDEDDDGDYDEEDEEDLEGVMGDFGQEAHGISSVVLVNELRDQLLGQGPGVLQNVVFDQEQSRMEGGDGMTFRVDIDLGQGGVIQGVHRGGQMRRMQMPPSRGMRGPAQGLGNGPAWEPGEMDAPAEHPLLRREPFPHGEQENNRMPPWMAPAGGLRHFLGSNFEPARSGPATAASPPVSEDFDAIFTEVSGRLQNHLRARPSTPSPSPQADVAEDLARLNEEAGRAAAPAETQAQASAQEAKEAPAAPVPAEPSAPEPKEPEAEAASAPAEAPAEAAPAEAAPAEAPAAAAEPAEDPAAALGIAELERLATSLGCTQTALLQAAEIDATVVAELPEEMRGAVVMATLSQVNVDHLRRSSAPPAGAAPDTGGDDEIDASVLEALPPEIRAEVMAEQERRRREQERARAAAVPAPVAVAPTASISGDMDNASFIASLDPMLREEVLMTAPEEVLQTLPAELVAEAQMIRDRAFMRIAREAGCDVSMAVQLQDHSHVQWPDNINTSRLWSNNFRREAGEDFMAQLGLALGGTRNRQDLISQLGMALGGSRGRQAPLVVAAGTNSPRLASFDKADRALLERLDEYDDCQETQSHCHQLPFQTSVSFCTSATRLL
ncbi:unnamed protein product [Effrenium voratum]|nr:unnamed protein product [Effrenium voratum]